MANGAPDRGRAASPASGRRSSPRSPRWRCEHGAANLGQGFPDFPAPDFVKEAAARHIREDRNQYAASAGVPRLRRALADDYRRRWPRTAAAVDPDAEVTVASGATELLHDAILAVVNPGDEVIVFEPAYDAYAPDVAMAGGTLRAVPLAPPDWRFDPARAGGGVRSAHARADPEHAAQPDRQGVPARRAGGDRRALPPPRRAGRSPTRSTRSSSSARRHVRSPRCPACTSGPSPSTAWGRPSA